MERPIKIANSYVKLHIADFEFQFNFINGNFRILKWDTVPYFWPYFFGIFPEI